MKQRKNIKSILKLSLTWLLVSLLSACGGSNTNAPETPNKTTLKIPTPLQKLAVGQGELIAYVLLDGGDERFPMDINTAGGGSATVVLPGLSRRRHNITITYEFIDDNGSLILAQITEEANLTAGSLVLNIDAGGYNLAFDEDLDGITNADELLAGSDPRISIIGVDRLEINAEIPKLNAVAISGGTLHVFITLDGNTENPMDMNIDIIKATASILLTNLTREEHTYFITFEYTEATETYILATTESTVDLTRGGFILPTINAAAFDFASYDDDADGTYNIDEIINSLDPRAENLPVAAVLNLSYEGVKTFKFTWDDAGGDAITYRLQENSDGNSGFPVIERDIPARTQVFDHVVTLYARQKAQYILQSCNRLGCVDSEQVNVKGNLAGSIGFFESVGSMAMSGDGHTLAVTDDERSSNNGDVTIFTDETGVWQEQAVILPPYIYSGGKGKFKSVELSADGLTLAMYAEDNRIGSGINSTETATVEGSITRSFGSVYIYIRTDDNWVQQAYIKASNPDLNDLFGFNLSISNDGNTLVVGALFESSDASGTAQTIDQLNNNLPRSGAVYVFARNNLGVWRQQTYIKSSNPDEDDRFTNVSLSGDGLTLVVSATGEDSGLTGITLGNGLQLPINNNVANSGAIYVYTLNKQTDTWAQEAYIKAGNADQLDYFGNEFSLSFNGNTLAVAAIGEESGDRNNPADNTFTQKAGDTTKAGAVYIFERDINGWVQKDYIKPELIYEKLGFGSALSLSRDGKILAIGAVGERSNAIGLGGLQGDNGSPRGAAYLFVRDIDNWIQRDYIKASKAVGSLGSGIKLSDDGSVLAVEGDGVYLY